MKSPLKSKRKSNVGEPWPRTYGSGSGSNSGSGFFLQWLLGCKKKKKNFHNFFFSLKNLILRLKFCVKILFCKDYFRKGKDPDPHLWLMDPDPVFLQAQKHSDPDPQHCTVKAYRYFFVTFILSAWIYILNIKFSCSSQPQKASVSKLAYVGTTILHCSDLRFQDFTESGSWHFAKFRSLSGYGIAVTWSLPDFIFNHVQQH